MGIQRPSAFRTHSLEQPPQLAQPQQDIAQSLSSRVNEAYNSLLHPLRRAEYILEQHGLPISENDQLDDLEFISEIMQTRESIDEATDADELARILDDNAGTSQSFD